MDSNLIIDLMLENCLVICNNSYELFTLLLKIRIFNKFYKSEVDKFINLCLEHKPILRRNINFPDISKNIESYFYKYLFTKNQKEEIIISYNNPYLKSKFPKKYNCNTLNCAFCNEIINTTVYSFNWNDIEYFYENYEEEELIDTTMIYNVFNDYCMEFMNELDFISCSRCGLDICSESNIPVSPRKMLSANSTYVQENSKKKLFFEHYIKYSEVYSKYLRKEFTCDKNFCDPTNNWHGRYCFSKTIKRNSCDCIKCR
jgi:hypothetical protein